MSGTGAVLRSTGVHNGLGARAGSSSGTSGRRRTRCSRGSEACRRGGLAVKLRPPPEREFYTSYALHLLVSYSWWTIEAIGVAAVLVMDGLRLLLVGEVLQAVVGFLSSTSVC